MQLKILLESMIILLFLMQIIWLTPNFLAETNRYANAGYLAIQGQRTAKNLDTVYACADSIGEFYKNYVERLAPSLLGSSSVISGSGMAIERELYQSYLDSPEIQEGKELGKRMLARG